MGAEVISVALNTLGVLLPMPSFFPLTGTGGKEGQVRKTVLKKDEAVSVSWVPGETHAAQVPGSLAPLPLHERKIDSHLIQVTAFGTSALPVQSTQNPPN